MRALFANKLFEQMDKDPNIFVLTADLGYGMWDNIRRVYPTRFFNIGAAEQSMLDMGVGLALSGRIPILYSITPFLLYRGFETIRTYINYENIPVKLVGSGRNKDYKHDGFSHWSEDDIEILYPFKNLKIFYPNSKEDLHMQFESFLYNKKPGYLNLSRTL